MATGYTINATMREYVINVNLNDSGFTAKIGEKIINTNIQGAIIVQPSDVIQFSAINKENNALIVGEFVRPNTLGNGILRASASSLPAVGWATIGVASGTQEPVRTQGLLTLSDWTSVIGSATLVPNTDYFLSTTSGKLTASPDLENALFVQYVGKAVTLTLLNVSLGQPIYL